MCLSLFCSLILCFMLVFFLFIVYSYMLLFMVPVFFLIFFSCMSCAKTSGRKHTTQTDTASNTSYVVHTYATILVNYMFMEVTYLYSKFSQFRLKNTLNSIHFSFKM